MTLNGYDAFLLNTVKALTKNTSIQTLDLPSESLYIVTSNSHHTHSVCSSVNDVAMNSVPITSFLWKYTHTLSFVLYVPVCESVLARSRYIHVMFPSCGFMQHVMLHSALYVQREPICVPSLNVWILFGMLCATRMICC